MRLPCSSRETFVTLMLVFTSKTLALPRSQLPQHHQCLSDAPAVQLEACVPLSLRDSSVLIQNYVRWCQVSLLPAHCLRACLTLSDRYCIHWCSPPRR